MDSAVGYAPRGDHHEKSSDLAPQKAQPRPGHPPKTPRPGRIASGQLYRAQNNNHYTVFLVTPEGIIMSDPINRDFARWLKAEIATRFKVPVRYVLYTHRDWDHASGGVVFADTAEFVGHRNMLAALARLRPAIRRCRLTR